MTNKNKMTEVCVYCGSFKNDRLSCCGENHWESLEDQIKSEMEIYNLVNEYDLGD